MSILHFAGTLPSVSLAYKMSKGFKHISSSVKLTQAKCFRKNVTLTDVGKCLVSLKMDETFVKPTLAYNARDNEPVGVCFKHGKI